MALSLASLHFCISVVDFLCPSTIPNSVLLFDGNLKIFIPWLKGLEIKTYVIWLLYKWSWLLETALSCPWEWIKERMLLSNLIRRRIFRLHTYLSVGQANKKMVNFIDPPLLAGNYHQHSIARITVYGWVFLLSILFIAPLAWTGGRLRWLGWLEVSYLKGWVWSCFVVSSFIWKGFVGGRKIVWVGIIWRVGLPSGYPVFEFKVVNWTSQFVSI